jgi:hypothetical protein
MFLCVCICESIYLSYVHSLSLPYGWFERVCCSSQIRNKSRQRAIKELQRRRRRLIFENVFRSVAPSGSIFGKTTFFQRKWTGDWQ